MVDKFEKVDSRQVKVIKTVEEFVNVDELHAKLQTWKDQLQVVNNNYAAEISRLNAGIAEIEAQLADAEAVGVITSVKEAEIAEAAKAAEIIAEPIEEIKKETTPVVETPVDAAPGELKVE